MEEEQFRSSIQELFQSIRFVLSLDSRNSETLLFTQVCGLWGNSVGFLVAIVVLFGEFPELNYFFDNFIYNNFWLLFPQAFFIYSPPPPGHLTFCSSQPVPFWDSWLLALGLVLWLIQLVMAISNCWIGAIRAWGCVQWILNWRQWLPLFSEPLISSK